MNPLRWPLALQTIAAMALGIALGAAAGPKVAFLGVLAKLIITLIKTFATPLLFFAILDGVLQAQFRGRGFALMLGISAFNGGCAIAFALLILNVFHPGKYLPLPGATAAVAAGKIDWNQAVASLVPDSIAGPFTTNAIPAVIILALLFGGALRAVEERAEAEDVAWIGSARRGTGVLLRMHLQILHWIVRFSPIAVFGAVAKSAGEQGMSVVAGLGAYVATCLGGMALQVLIVYQAWIALVAGIPLRVFWRAARDAIAYSFGVNSSLATLPLTLEGLAKLRISPGAARMAACVGTNFNNDGILLYEVAATLFLAQAYGMALSIPEQLFMSGICVLATLGVAGVPEAGIISLTLVLATVGLPAESLPMLLTVDWLVARVRSVVNVASDMTVAIGIDALEGGETARGRAR